MVHVPNLGEQSCVRIYHSFDVLFESPDDHGVGHGERKREMGCHLCSYILGSIIEDEAGSSGMMLGEGGDIENIGIEDHKDLLILCSVALQFSL